MFFLKWLASRSRGSLHPTGLDYFFGAATVRKRLSFGAVAQLGERLICTQEVAGSIPTSSTSGSAGGGLHPVIFTPGPVAQMARAHP